MFFHIKNMRKNIFILRKEIFYDSINSVEEVNE